MPSPTALEPGARVGAILRLTMETLEFLGFGVYEGDRLVPNWRQHALDQLPTMRTIYARDAAKSLDDWLAWLTRPNTATRGRAPAEARTDAEVRALAQASLLEAQERLRWTDE